MIGFDEALGLLSRSGVKWAIDREQVIRNLSGQCICEWLRSTGNPVAWGAGNMLRWYSLFPETRDAVLRACGIGNAQ
jgi:hypothetical protein